MDNSATLVGILLVTAVVYATRLAGYFIGSRIGSETTAGRVLDALPGAALGGVLALSLLQNAGPADLFAMAVTTGLYLWTRQTLPALGAGLLIAVASAHLVA